MKFIGLFVLFSLLVLGFTRCGIPCKIYANATMAKTFCQSNFDLFFFWSKFKSLTSFFSVPNYPIAPIIEFLNESRTDDVSKQFQEAWKQISDQMEGVYAMVPKFLRSPNCMSAIGNFACGSILRRCDEANIPDLSTPPTDFDLNPEDLGFAPCEDMCDEIVDSCVSDMARKIPGFGKAISNFINNNVCKTVKKMQMDVKNPKKPQKVNKKMTFFAPAPNCTNVCFIFLVFTFKSNKIAQNLHITV